MDIPDDLRKERRTELVERVESLEGRVGSLETEVSSLGTEVKKMPVAIAELHSKLANFDERFFGVPGTAIGGLAGDIAEIKKYAQNTNGSVRRHDTELTEIKARCNERYQGKNYNTAEALTPFKKGSLLATGVLLLMGTGYGFWRFVQWIQQLQIGK